MEQSDLIKGLEGMLPEKVPYGDLIGAEGLYAHSGPLVYEDPEPYFIEQAIAELKKLSEIQDILGPVYDTDHLRELVEADKAKRRIKTKGFENRGDIVTGGIVYYADEETMEVQKGQISSVKTKNGNAETFLVNFPNFACSEEFHVSEWNDCVFRDYAEAEAALEKMKETQA